MKKKYQALEDAYASYNNKIAISFSEFDVRLNTG